jgi:YesN/AraC family two-component response regulator
VYKASSGAEALRLLAERQIPIVVTDQRMPEMTGVQLLAEVHRCAPLVIGILLTGYSDLPAVIDAINIGQVFRYREKPWDVDVLRGDLEAAGQLYEAQLSQTEQLQRLNPHLE